MRPLHEYFDELQRLDHRNIGSWPNWAHGLALALVAVVTLLVGLWCFVLPRHAALVQARQAETRLKQSFRVKQAQAATLGAYHEQSASLSAKLDALVASFPERKEVPALLKHILHLRDQNGLDGVSLKPAREQNAHFYKMLPYELSVTGNFHQFGRFISDIAALPHLVTISNIHIEPVTRPRNRKKTTSTGLLHMRFTATTYRSPDKADSVARSGESGS